MRNVMRGGVMRGGVMLGGVMRSQRGEIYLLKDGAPQPPTTFSRASTGTYWDANGVLQTADVDELRLTHDPANGELQGLLIEGQRANKCQNYNLNPDAGLTNISASAGTLARIDDSVNVSFSGGAVGGNVFHLNNTTGGPVTITATGPTGNTNAHSLRVYCRFTGTAPTLQLTGGTGGVSCNNAYAETKSQNVTPLAATDEWQLSVPDGTEVWFIGNQMEEGVYLTSPIETDGSAKTRSRDIVTVGNIDFVDLTKGTFIVEMEPRPYSEVGNARIIAGQGPTTLLHTDLSNRVGAYNGAGIITTNSYTPGELSKAAFRYQGSQRSVVLNGGAISSDQNFPNGEFDDGKLYIGAAGNGSSPANCPIKNVHYIPRALSDGELQAETTL